jgi:hypothetical protein
MPRADQATLAVDRSIGEIGTEMPTSASHREQLTVRVSDRVRSGTADNPGASSAAAPTSVSRAIAPPRVSLVHRSQQRPDRARSAVERAGCDVTTERGIDVVCIDQIRPSPDRRLGVLTPTVE